MQGFALIWLALLLVINTAGAADMAGWVGDLLRVHKEALVSYQKDHDATKAYIALQRVGIAKAIERKPEGISKQAYVNLLNDYAFFLYESTAFKTNVHLTVHLKDFAFVGSERMLRYDDIPNATVRLNRLCRAKHILQKTIELDPERAVAYLNLGDVYWLSAQYAQKLGFFSGRQGHEAEKVLKNLECADEMKVERFGYVVTDFFIDFFNAYDTYKIYQAKMVEQDKAKKIPGRITKLLSRMLGYTVVQDNGLELGDQQLCIDYENALNSLSDDEIDFSAANYYPNDPGKIEKKLKTLAEQGIDSFTATSRRGDITQYDTSFKRIPFSSLREENRKAMEKNKFSFYSRYGVNHPDQVLKYNGNTYVDSRTGFLYMIHADPEVRKWYGLHSWRCIYEMLNFEKRSYINK